MTLRTAKDAADFLAGNAQNGEGSINFFGGEPLLCWGSVIVPLTKYVREKYGKGFQLSMTSNCTLMDEGKLKFMRENEIGLLCSADGDRKTQDRNRPLHNGGSSFDIMQEKLPLVLRYYPNVTFRATVTQDTADDLFHNMMFAEGLGFQSFFVIPNSFEVWEDMTPLRREMRKYSDHYIDCMREGKDPIYFSELEKRFSKIRARNEAIYKENMRENPSCKACGKCGLGASRFAGIDINGDLIACQELFSYCDDHFTIGNIYTGTNDEARERLIKEFDSVPVTGDDCEGCKLNRICDGGCVANNYLQYGDMHRISPVCCEWERILFDEAVYIMQTLGGEKNERFRERWKRHRS